MPVAKKFVTKEYHEGQAAYINGLALTTNPYLQSETVGKLWYWAWGWNDAMADDIRSIKQTLLTITQPIDNERLH